MVVRAEGVGLDDVRAGFEIMGVDFLDDLRLASGSIARGCL